MYFSLFEPSSIGETARHYWHQILSADFTAVGRISIFDFISSAKGDFLRQI
jgi:hypothetical protein